MAKTRFWFSLVYKLLVGSISSVVLLAQFDSLGANAWRLLETWLLLVAAGYFLISAFAEWFRRKEPMPHYSWCSLLQGFIIVVGIGLGILRVFYQINSLEWLGARGLFNYIQLLGIPLLTIIDWLFFTKKGGWGFSYPWYWLGIIISYCCVIILIADFVPAQSEWVYPYYFLNYSALDINIFILWVILISVIILAIGYVFMLLDYAMSGQLNQHIVMPKIKTIVIEEPLVIEPEAVAEDEVAKVTNNLKLSSAKPKTETKPEFKPKKQPSMDIIKPVEGLKDQKSAQKIHRANKNNSKSKSEIIADMRLQVSGNKNSKSRSRTQTRTNNGTKTIKKF